MISSVGDPQRSAAFRRMAGVLAVIALPLAFASNLLLLIPFGFDLAAASDPVEAFNLESGSKCAMTRSKRSGR
jgi:hypothetical protein